MAALNQPHWETIESRMRDLLDQIGQCSFASRFYLAGGTALALQIGHRRSVDLDFFSQTDEVKPETHREILDALHSLNPTLVERAFGNLVLSVHGVSVGFFSYGYPLVGQTLSVENVMLASVADIGLMKLDALITRGSRKDFYDVYFIARQIPLDELLKLGQTKYPMVRDFPFMVFKNMILFDNADRDAQPDLLITTDWGAVKKFLIEQEKQLRREWFGF